jgi:TonB family protein
MKIVCLVFALDLIGVGTVYAQVAGAPVLGERPVILYPLIAKAAHVTGEVVVRFSINDDGSTSAVVVVSGPVMLQDSLANAIKGWRFATPLPIDARKEFEAVYRFGVDAPDESADDDLDMPPYRPCCGDVIILPPGSAQVKGEVRSVDGSQTIDVSPGAPKAVEERCQSDKKQVPIESSEADHVELFRACMNGCRDYRVRVNRDGLVEWLGRDEVAVKGPVQTNIGTDMSEKLIDRFRTQAFWSACSAKPPALEEARSGEDFQSGTYLTAKIAGNVKSVRWDDGMTNLAWAVDKAVNTHRWIHGDEALEPFANMSEDVGMPKPGMTALIRATFHFSQATGQQTADALKRLLATPGVDVDAADESGWTALMYAAELTYDDKEIGMLLEAHANPNRVSLHGDTALMMAAYNGRLSERLLESGAEINARNADGVTALMLIAQHVKPDELKAAIIAGADAAAEDEQGRTALDYLRAASCQKAIVPLPKPWMTIGYAVPPPCPVQSKEYKESEAVLKAVMKHRVR